MFKTILYEKIQLPTQYLVTPPVVFMTAWIFVLFVIILILPF